VALNDSINSLYVLFFPSPPFHLDSSLLFYLVFRVIAAAYFILGAPPFLKWATRKSD
jgi:hypothetical protein